MTIKISALRAIFDQLMTFGIEPFKTKKIKALQSEDAEINTDGDQEFKEAEEETATAKNVLKLLSDFLDSEVRNNHSLVITKFLFIVYVYALYFFRLKLIFDQHLKFLPSKLNSTFIPNIPCFSLSDCMCREMKYKNDS